jgi:hypothetical protein
MLFLLTLFIFVYILNIRISTEELVEKHSILDVMFHGESILKNLPELEFKTTFKIIDQYADPNKVDSKRKAKLTLLHYRFIEKYT